MLRQESFTNETLWNPPSLAAHDFLLSAFQLGKSLIANDQMIQHGKTFPNPRDEGNGTSNYVTMTLYTDRQCTKSLKAVTAAVQGNKCIKLYNSENEATYSSIIHWNGQSLYNSTYLGDSCDGKVVSQQLYELGVCILTGNSVYPSAKIRLTPDVFLPIPVDAVLQLFYEESVTNCRRYPIGYVWMESYVCLYSPKKDRSVMYTCSQNVIEELNYVGSHCSSQYTSTMKSRDVCHKTNPSSNGIGTKFTMICTSPTMYDFKSSIYRDELISKFYPGIPPIKKH